MLSLAQAIHRRQSSGKPLPVVYPALAAAGANISQGQLSLVVGPPTAGKSLLVMNLLARMREPALAFLLDQPQTMATARFASIVCNEDYMVVKDAIVNGRGQEYADYLAYELGHIQTCFLAFDVEDVRREIDAFEQRYGLPPTVILLDNHLGALADLREHGDDILHHIGLAEMQHSRLHAFHHSPHRADRGPDTSKKRH